MCAVFYFILFFYLTPPAAASRLAVMIFKRHSRPWRYSIDNNGQRLHYITLHEIFLTWPKEKPQGPQKTRKPS